MSMRNKEEFTEKVREAVNYSSVDADMGIPDFILADMVVSFLYSVMEAKVKTEEWKKNTGMPETLWDDA